MDVQQLTIFKRWCWSTVYAEPIVLRMSQHPKPSLSWEPQGTECIISRRSQSKICTCFLKSNKDIENRYQPHVTGLENTALGAYHLETLQKALLVWWERMLGFCCTTSGTIPNTNLWINSIKVFLAGYKNNSAKQNWKEFFKTCPISLHSMGQNK